MKKLNMEARSLRGQALQNGQTAIENAHIFGLAQQKYEKLNTKRMELADEANGTGGAPGAVLLLIVLGILMYGGYRLGLVQWGELLGEITGATGQVSNITAGIIGAALSLGLVMASIYSHLKSAQYDSVGFESKSDYSNLAVILIAAGRLGLGIFTWYFSQYTNMLADPEATLELNTLGYVGADLVLILVEYYISKIFARRGLPQLYLLILGISLWQYGRTMNKASKIAYNSHIRQVEYSGLFNNEPENEPKVQIQGSPLLEGAINYYTKLGKTPVGEPEIPTNSENQNSEKAVTEPNLNSNNNINEKVNNMASDIAEETTNDEMEEYINEQKNARDYQMFD